MFACALVGGGIVLSVYSQYWFGPIQVHPVALVSLSRFVWIRFRNVAFGEMYLRNEFEPQPTTPLATPPPPLRS